MQILRWYDVTKHIGIVADFGMIVFNNLAAGVAWRPRPHGEGLSGAKVLSNGLGQRIQIVGRNVRLYLFTIPTFDQQ